MPTSEVTRCTFPGNLRGLTRCFSVVERQKTPHLNTCLHICHSLRYATANREDGARLDVVARDFWGQNRQRAFFDVRVFNPFVRSYSHLPLSRCYRTHEQEKRRAYDERIREVERACFSPLVFAASGGMGPVATINCVSETCFFAGQQMEHQLQPLPVLDKMSFVFFIAKV